jgi:predicted esterase
MSIHIAIVAPFLIGGVVGLSGEVFPSLQKMINDDKDGTFDDKKKNLNLFLYHGKEDDVIKHGIAAKTYEKLKESGFAKVKFYSDEFLAHSVNDKDCEMFVEFLRELMI